jgi:hypothetical protein
MNAPVRRGEQGMKVSIKQISRRKQSGHIEINYTPFPWRKVLSSLFLYLSVGWASFGISKAIASEFASATFIAVMACWAAIMSGRLEGKK